MKQNDQAPRQRDLLIQIVCEQQDVWPLTQARAILWERFVLGFTMLTVSHRQHFPGKWTLINETLSRVYNLNEKENTREGWTEQTDGVKPGGSGRSESQNVKQQHIKHSPSCILQWKYGHGQHCLPAWEKLSIHVISFWLLFILCVHIFSLFCRIILFWNFHYVEVSHLVSVWF